MIKILAIDKIKEKAIRDSIDIYLKRLENKLKIEIIECPPAKYHTFDSLEKAKVIEAEKLMSNIFKRELSSSAVVQKSFIIALDERGIQYNSPDFSKLLYETLNHKHIVFVIGGAYGLSEDILLNADLVLSLSKMTFTHEMARLFLVEQLYRALTIEKNIKYHNS